jgi:ribA/ribD-fused uncharacterized protein
MREPTVISNFDSFDGANEWAFLSNFYVGEEPLSFRGRKYQTGEHMFQAFKARNRTDHERIAGQTGPHEAKAEGRHLLRLRPDWERVKYDVMRLVLATKFRLEREEGPLLLATGDALLVEGTMWGDRVWGVDLKAGRKRWLEENGEIHTDATWDPGDPWEISPGRNWLGVLLMARRCELLAQTRDPRKFSYRETAHYAMEVPRPTA